MKKKMMNSFEQEDCIVLVDKEKVQIINTRTLESDDLDESSKYLLDCEQIEVSNLKPSEYSLMYEYMSAEKLVYGNYLYGLKIVVTNIFGGTLFDKKILGAAVITMNVENEDGSISLTPFPSEVDAQFFVDNYLSAYLLTDPNEKENE